MQLSKKILKFQPEGWIGGEIFGWSENFNEHPLVNLIIVICYLIIFYNHSFTTTHSLIICQDSWISCDNTK